MEISYKTFEDYFQLKEWAKNEDFKKIINVETLHRFSGKEYYKVWYESL